MRTPSIIHMRGRERFKIVGEVKGTKLNVRGEKARFLSMYHLAERYRDEKFSIHCI